MQILIVVDDVISLMFLVNKQHLDTTIQGQKTLISINALFESFVQTYERSCIQKWLDAGHKTCPKTQQTLLHTALTPNYVLKSLITLWCENNGVELPRTRNL